MKSNPRLRSRHVAWLVLWLACWVPNSVVRADERALEDWLPWQAEQSAQAMLTNITPQGAVIASPSTLPDYRYHWVRDGALTMATVHELSQRTASGADHDRLIETLWDYAAFSRRNQLTPNPSGEADGAGVGEPKFNLDGSAYNESWGRPQNDGPALRASTLIRLANELLDQGREDEVRSRLYDPNQAGGSVIKTDLEYVSHHWRDPSFDLWEEVRGAHFYTQLVQRRALLDGAALASRLGDEPAASWYRKQAQALEGAISRHWDAGRGQIMVTLPVGERGKVSGLDIAVILGVLHADAAGDGFFAPEDPRVLATARKLDEAFRWQYSINERASDSDGLALGTAIGRYPEDTYNGVSIEARGNPWFLATAAMAEHSYRTANRLEAQGRVTVTGTSAPFYNELPALSRAGGVHKGERLRMGKDPRFAALIEGLREKGDAYLRRIKFHADGTGALSEQFNRDTGYMESAAQLTWSHAAILTAFWARQ